ncbi:isoprenylcysteine carboxyl methyltransferase family protein [Bacillus sp. Marseille-Q1617]|uniref:isoprenylcysteine carboxyl methyltransferase family protein n=1 Tax=Bacillus sp. Marseille-Q1617 TaxID=2736887 RepID=UPI00158D2302|nr:isoprenylcysteine carboxylmethyltransferase family protein [Bacillus sp. Marseille-Q1617]
MTFFLLFFTILVIQRAVELVIARKNERWMKSRGAKEFGQGHYRTMVMIHFAFFVSLLIEGGVFHSGLHPLWKYLLAGFILTQAGRIWVISSLGKYWNTKIIVLPNTEVVSTGPYKLFRHPNYLIVTLELAVIPLLFNAYWTLIIFALLNQLILFTRIPVEEQALRSETDYERETPGWIGTLKKEK